MKWAGRVLGTAKLSHCCEALDITITDAHSALCDAQATAQLMAQLAQSCEGSAEWFEDLQRCAGYAWPAPARRATHVAAVPRGQAGADPHGWLRTVLRAAWIPASPENEAAYLLMLEHALLDRSISRTEGRQLVETAESAGLRPETVARLHRDYLRAIAREALADGVVTDAERADLLTVAGELELAESDVDAALAWAASHTENSRAASAFVLYPGDRVVFTGDMVRSRDSWIAAVTAAGLTTGGVTKSTRVLVAADPDSLSGKAAKARAYGIPVIGERAFARMLAAYQRTR